MHISDRCEMQARLEKASIDEVYVDVTQLVEKELAVSTCLPLVYRQFIYAIPGCSNPSYILIFPFISQYPAVCFEAFL